MKQRRFLLTCAVWLLASLTANPSLQAARKKQAAPKKEQSAKQQLPTEEELFRQKTAQQIKDLQTDVGVKWAALQEIKKEADDTASRVTLVTWIGVGIGFLVGCAVTLLVGKRMKKSDDTLKIT
jgi:ElaB/YqjD/DUF883 family membrane-anchored ribosome-binding protein